MRPDFRSGLLAALLLISSPILWGGEGDIRQKAENSLRRQFGDSISISVQEVILARDEILQIARSSKSSWPTDTINVYVCRLEGSVTGYGIVDVVRGKVQPFTYLVGLNADGEVTDIDVLAYREAYGGEISNSSFRQQFRSKTAQDELLPGRTIKNISGATISVRAITNGIRRVLATFAIIQERL